MNGTGYSQTILLDCNRLSSVEYNGSSLSKIDTGVFTNMVTGGLDLNIGDKVSVDSAYIAERGAGGTVIEFKGKSLDKQKVIEYTNTLNSSFIGNASSPSGYVATSSSLITETIDLVDNEVSFVVSYFKNANGENYITLPRYYGAARQGNKAYANTKDGAEGMWTLNDSFFGGAIQKQQNASHFFADDYYDSEISITPSPQTGTARKIRNNNDKYTLFKKNYIVYNGSLVGPLDLNHYLSGLDETSTLRDPALALYSVYKEKKTISVGKGFNSPSNVAGSVTDQLLQTQNPIVTNIEATSGSGQIIRVESTLNRGIEATDFNKFSVISASGYLNGSDNASSVSYLSAYNYVGFKRPKFVEQGRKSFAYHGNDIGQATPLSASGTAVIYTEISWTENALQNVRDLFAIEHDAHPELIKNGASATFTNYTTYNTTSSSLQGSFLEESRFLHISPFKISGATVPMGSDMYDEYSGSDLSSLPIFCYYNNNSSHLTSSDSIGDRDDNLVYGFARRWTDSGGTHFVALTTQRIGGVPAWHFNEGTNLELKRIGYDYHFSAYGNAAIILNNGFNETQYYGRQKYVLAPHVRHTMIGTTKPLLNFNTVESRFELSQLHTPEKVGNFWSSGDPKPAASTFAPPPTAQADSDVYKINKKLEYNTWSPSMMPYQELTTALVNTSSTLVTALPMNENLEEGIIYDSHSGIIIEDFGVGEVEFEDSFWGILGFTWNQFNPSGSHLSPNITRFNNATLNVSGATTNALIQSTDAPSYNVNLFGTNIFTNTVSTPSAFYPTSTWQTAPKNASIIDPTIVVTATSTALQATNLPRKTLRGYYLLKSDILSDSNYYRHTNPIQIMALVSKYNAELDFINYAGGGTEFTVTKKTTLTSIETQILDPDGSLADVGDNSAVVYKVIKQINTDLNFAETIMSQSKK
jgi:hypothetical protein